MIYVAAIQYFDTADDTVKVKYVATEGFATKPTDTPANTIVEGRVVNPALIRRDIFDVGTTGGASRVDYGTGHETTFAIQFGHKKTVLVHVTNHCYNLTGFKRKLNL